MESDYLVKKTQSKKSINFEHCQQNPNLKNKIVVFLNM